MQSERLRMLMPFAFAAFPILFLYGQNIDWVRPVDLVKPMLLPPAAAVVLLCAAWMLLHDWTRAALAASVVPRIARLAAKPDIHYILLDNYSRADVLKREFGRDNSEFLAVLRLKGFYVAKQSDSNYLDTLASMPSWPNLGYLDQLGKEAGIRVRHAIINAYHLPESGRKLLYSSISPVNSFRVVFNCCFGTDYPLLKDSRRRCALEAR